MATAPLWLKDPLAILASGAERGVVVADGRIVELVAAGREAATPGAVAFDAGAHVVLPGLINTHHHFYQTLTRATPAALDRELFGWLGALYPIWARLTPEALESAATVAMAELLLSGCTTTTDHHYVFPAGLEQAIDVEVAVARRLGIRVTLTRGSMNLSQRDGGLPPDAVVQDEDTILADSVRLIDAYHDPSPDALVRIALAPCSPFTVTPSLMRATAALAAQRGVRLHTHLAETADETAFCQGRFGCRPLDYLEQIGLAARSRLARARRAFRRPGNRPPRARRRGRHALPVQQPDPRFRPLPGLRHGSGRAARRAWRGRLGVQQRLQPHAGGARGLPAATPPLRRHARRAIATRCAGRRRARPPASAGRNSAVSPPGTAADLALFRLDELRFAGAQRQLAALVLAGAHRADRVMVGGRWVVTDGAIPGLGSAGIDGPPAGGGAADGPALTPQSGLASRFRP